MRQNERGITLARVVLALSVFYVSGLLLNAGSLKKGAELMQYGWRREAALAMVSPVAGFSRKLFLDRPREMMDRTSEIAGRFLGKAL